jgi:uncharacterized protein
MGAPPFTEIGGSAMVRGGGLGYRSALDGDIRKHTADIDWLELIADQFFPLTGQRRDKLAELSGLYPCVTHSLNLSIGGWAPLDMEYLHAVVQAGDAINAPWFSDHLCFTGDSAVTIGHLAPLSFTRISARHVAERAATVQRLAQRPLLLENITYKFSIGTELDEAEYIAEILEQADCGMLLDINNLYTNSISHGYDPLEFLDRIPMHRVRQLHLAGGRWIDGVLEDSHDTPVRSEVWQLAREAVSRSPVGAIMIERDSDFPDEFADLLAEVAEARALSTAP